MTTTEQILKSILTKIDEIDKTVDRIYFLLSNYKKDTSPQKESKK